MTRKPITAFTDEELVEEFVACAHAWGDFTEADNVKLANRMMRRVVKLFDELKARGPATRLKLVPFLDSMDPGIRYLAGDHLLTLLPERSRAAIESVWKAGRWGISLSAGMTLGNLDDGLFTPT